MAHTHYHHATMNNRPASQAVDTNFLGEPTLWKFLLLTALIYLVWSEKISIVLDLSPAQAREQLALGGQKVKASLLPELVSNVETAQPRRGLQLPAGPTNNLTFAIDPGFAERYQIESGAVESALSKCRDYIGRFAPVAVAEMRKSGIPASIILAQGLLESNCGDSKLARTSNNHFGIKCFSNRCKKGHCVNFSDDSHKDFFVKYSNVWSSYRAHSQFLKKSKRYAALFELGSSDYDAWAKGLAKAGYATDKKYGEKLIALIENLNLDQYDRQ